jgi:dipeptidyl aminopeptidase/acylaminoacyl peptidase
VRLDPSDARRAIIAPSQLLAPNTAYQLAVNVAALDIDGNQLARNQTIRFKTSSPRPLRHWVAFATQGADGAAAGLWIVNESGFPRQLFDTTSVHAFSWSPAGDRLLVRGDGDTWSEVVPGSSTVQLPFKGVWAAALASGMGYVYIDDSGTLNRAPAGGPDEVIATDVAQAAVAPNGLRVAFVQGAIAPNAVWGYDVGLRARYQLALDTGPVSEPSWSPLGNRIAYLRSEGEGLSLRLAIMAARFDAHRLRGVNRRQPQGFRRQRRRPSGRVEPGAWPARGSDGGPVGACSIARRPPVRLRQRRSGLADECRRNASDPAHAV